MTHLCEFHGNIRKLFIYLILSFFFFPAQQRRHPKQQKPRVLSISKLGDAFKVVFDSLTLTLQHNYWWRSARFFSIFQSKLQKLPINPQKALQVQRNTRLWSMDLFQDIFGGTQLIIAVVKKKCQSVPYSKNLS